VDWIVSTGANLYHDAHFGLGWRCTRGRTRWTTACSAPRACVRIYDVLFDYSVLLETDAYLRKVMQRPEFQRDMSTRSCTSCSGNTSPHATRS
jgi:deoxyhypusine synthase